ncbi:Na(+)/H(+) antiporter subunit B [Vulgatibacter sp.]|uniref:Na(+)/H(+) antiporter subunit B n=1 Tax=Vulgatibacter sp. TaxID=1971226 RepID=UPI0035672557
MIVDWILALSIPALALASLGSANLFRGVVLFLSFGVLIAIAWARLGAVDVALAEVALGSGFTAALLVAARRWIGDDGGA